MESKNLINKFKKKLRRHQHMITKETNVMCTENPTKYLGICNVGLVNGVTEEIIIENFNQFGALHRILLIPGKSCSFLSFEDECSAKRAFTEKNFKELTGFTTTSPIYLTYVEALPEVKDNKIYARLPPGLTIIEDFITEEEEKLLLSLCQFDDHEGDVLRTHKAKHFGYQFLYGSNDVGKNPLKEKIPAECDFIWERLPFDFCPDQLTVNYYAPGDGIPPHIDTHSAFEEHLLSLSLNSPIVMEFKRNETICVLLPARSLAIMAGECRYAWKHGIASRKHDFIYTENGCVSFKRGTRISFTFRKVKNGKCNCAYNIYCDSHDGVGIAHELASKLENEHVHSVYETIADHFSETRHTPWPNVLKFVEKLPLGSVLVDVGCGNGKYFGHQTQTFELGTDHSHKLCGLCRERGFESFRGDCLSIPLKDESVDAVISIAVLHHLSNEKRRIDALKEITRILKVGGEALVYVWAKQQVKNNEKSAYIKQDRKNRKQGDVTSINTEAVTVADGVNLPVHHNRRDFNHSDLLVPWKLKGSQEEFLRYYHVFDEGELDKLCEEVERLDVVKSYYDQGNYCVLFKKL